MEFCSQSEDLFDISNLFFFSELRLFEGVERKKKKGRKYKVPRIIYVEMSPPNFSDL